MLIIKFIRWAYKTLNGEHLPWQIALGFALGMATGLIPFGGLTLLGLIAIVMLNCHFGSGLFGLVIGLGLGALLNGPLFYPLGEWLIETGPHGLFLWLATTPGLAFLHLHQSATMGAIIVSLILGPVAFFAVRAGVVKLRAPVQSKLGKSKIAKALSNTFIFRGLRWLLIG